MTAEAPPEPLLAPAALTRGVDTGFGASGPMGVLPFSGRQVLLLAAITVLAAALRLWHLGDWSIWIDEAHTWRDVTMPIEDFFKAAPSWYPTSFLMLRFLMEHGWLQQFTEGWLRLPFAFCGILTVPLLALFGNLIVGRRAALLAALFLAINPWHIYWSQNARAYVLVGMFAVAAAGSWWLGILRGSRLWLVTGFALVLAGGSCHPTGLALLPVFLAYPLLAARRLAGRRIWIKAFAIGIGVTLLPSALELLPAFQIFQNAKPESQPSLVHLLQTTAFYFRLPLLCAAAIGVSMLFQQRLQGRVLYLACWALLPLLLLGIVGSTMVKVTARYGLAALPAVLLLAGAASVRVSELLVAGLGRSSTWSRVLAALVLPAILCLDMGAYDYMYYRVQYGDRGRWQEASRIVTRAGAGVDVMTTHEPVLQYYLRPNNYRSRLPPAFDQVRVFSIEPDRILDSAPPGTGIGDGSSYLRSLIVTSRGTGHEFFVIAALPELAEKDRDGSLRTALREQCELVEVLPCWVGPKDESVYIWRPRPGR